MKTRVAHQAWCGRRRWTRRCYAHSCDCPTSDGDSSRTASRARNRPRRPARCDRCPDRMHCPAYDRHVCILQYVQQVIHVKTFFTFLFWSRFLTFFVFKTFFFIFKKRWQSSERKAAVNKKHFFQNNSNEIQWVHK